MKNIIDLHMHSNVSLDGDYSVASLAQQCQTAGLEYVSLADHNSVAGVAEFIEHAKLYNIAVLPAIEIDCRYEIVDLHILGYGIDIEDPRFNALGVRLLNQERDGSQERIRLIEDLGITVNHQIIEKLQIDGIVTGEMIAEAALHEPENKDNPLLAPFREGGILADNPYVNFYWEYCAQGKPAYIHIDLPSLQDTVSLIHETGGYAVFAHPGHNIHEDTTLLEGIMNFGLDGIEAYSSYHSPDQIEFYSDYAILHNKLITCGSDYHGKIKPSIKLSNIELPQEIEAKLISFVRDTLEI